MNEFEQFVERVRALVHCLDNILTPDQCARIEHLISHDEHGEALRALAWIIVEERKFVPPQVVADIRSLSDGLVDDADMPPNLDEHIIRSK